MSEKPVEAMAGRGLERREQSSARSARARMASRLFAALASLFQLAVMTGMALGSISALWLIGGGGGWGAGWTLLASLAAALLGGRAQHWCLEQEAKREQKGSSPF